MATLATLIVKLTGDISEYEKSMEQAGRTLQNAGSAMTSAGKTLSAGVTLPLVAAGGASLHFANQFNAGMANVASLGAEAAEAVAGWGPMVQQMAIDTGKSTDDLAGGLYNVVSAFGVADDTLEVLDINARAAAGGLATTTEAINLTSAVTKAYGDTSADAVQHAADLALRTVQLGQTTFPEMAASLGRVTPLAASLGVGMDELFGVMATGTGVTGTAAEVSTQLRGILQSLMAPTADMATLIDEMGYANGAAMLQGEGLQNTIAAIVGAAEDGGLPLQAYMGSIEGQTLAMALAGPQAETFAEKMAAMQDVAGATDEAFAAQTLGVNAAGFAMQQARVQATVWAQQIGQHLAPLVLQLLQHVQPLVDWITALIARFSALDPTTQMVILGVIGFVAALGPLLIAAGMVVSAVGAIAAVLTGPVLLAIAAVIAIVAALAAGWSSNFLNIQQTFEQVWQAVQVAWQAFKALFQGDFATFWEMIKEAFGIALQAMIDLFGRIYEWALPHLEAFWASLQAWWQGIDWYQLGYDTVTFIIEALQTFWQTAVPVVSSWWDSIKSWFGSVDWPQLGLDIVNGIVRGLSNAASTLFNALKDLASGALDAAKDALGIRSPSLMAARLIGQPFTQGVAMGMRDTRPIDQAMARTVTPAMLAVAPGGGGGGVSLSAPITINVNGNADADDIAAKVQRVVDQLLFDAMRRQGITAS